MNANRNQLWARVVAEELVRSGIRDICVSPGSRSTPLVLAVGAQGGLRVTTHLDERSAAFFALGIAKATAAPAALLCTSGTAAANYLPAIVEANQSRVPLLVLTADRPPELRDVGANQAIDQQHLYGRHARWFADAGLPQVTPSRVRHLRALVCRAVAKATMWPAGPVHLNFPFQEPLEPTPVPGDVPDDWHKGDLEARNGRRGAPFLRIANPAVIPDTGILDEVAATLKQEPNGIIVAGPRFPDDDFADAIEALANATGYPVLADPLSGARFAGKPVFMAYDAWLADPKRRARTLPGVVVRFGAAPTSKNLLNWLKEAKSATQILVTDHPTFGEETTRASFALVGAASATARELAKRVPRRQAPPFAAKLAEQERVTRSIHEEALPKRAFEGAVLNRVIAQLKDNTQIFVSSSLPVRDLDRFGLTEKRLRVHGNRGASGIDGVTSTALGVAHATGKRVLLITGDLAFLHDLSGLIARHRLKIPLDVLVLDNDGGGIFEFLPIAQHEPPFTELFVTPHGLDLAAIGRALGLDTHEVDAATALKKTILGPDTKSGRLIVVKTDRKANVKHRRELEALVDAALEALPEASARAR